MLQNNLEGGQLVFASRDTGGDPRIIFWNRQVEMRDGQYLGLGGPKIFGDVHNEFVGGNPPEPGTCIPGRLIFVPDVSVQ